MRAITIRSLESKAHPETKKLLWFVFAGTRGGMNRIRIISYLRKMPSNTHRLAMKLGLDYKSIQHHLKSLEQNNLVTKVGGNYGATYFPSVLFEDGEAVFDEIVAKLNSNKQSKFELVLRDKKKIIHKNINDHEKVECPICNQEIQPYWEPRYNGIRATCVECGINWQES